MPLYLHLSIHLFLALMLGYFAGAYFRRPILCFTAALLGGVLIDMDHVLEYYVIFGNFNLEYFLQGRQFLVRDQMWIWFHAWEYLPVLLFFAWVLRKRAKIIAVTLFVLAMGAFIHLATDVIINNFPPRLYSIIYRQQNDFSAARLLPADRYLKNLELKRELGL